jgi:23S rRNA (guanosine2251-2'-O)-methyltransferase
LNNGNENIIYGTRAVIEALRAGKEIDKILVQKGISNELFRELKNELAQHSVPIQFVPPEKLKRISTKNHQGVIAFISEVHYYQCEDLLSEIFERGEIPALLILDRITDVRNFGAIARTAACMGVHFIIIPSRGAAAINSDAVKTSAGALHTLKVCREDNLKKTIEYLKESGLKIIACHEKTDTLIQQSDLKVPLAIIMGSEEDGISGEYLKRSDEQVKIRMVGNISSLNVSVATGMILYEVQRQRHLI